MNIQNNIIKQYLKNVLFITGTAYAGKSTMCKMLADRFNLYHCEENYNSDTIFKVIDVDNQPNLSYFNTKKDWQEYLNRTPEDYEKWSNGNNIELAGFEIAELIRVSSDRKIIVDTNIPLEWLLEIADYHQIAIMLSPDGMSADKFFERDDEEKVFLKDQILSGPTPVKTMANFTACIARINSKKYYDEFLNSGCYYLEREDDGKDTKIEVLNKLAQHFKLE